MQRLMRKRNAGSRRSASLAPVRRHVSLPLGHYLLGVGVVAGFDIGVGAGFDIGVGAGLDIGVGAGLDIGVVAGLDIGVGAGLDIGVGAGVGADSTGLGEGEAPGEPSALGEGDGLAFAVLCFVRA
jgi:hypothetical protein